MKNTKVSDLLSTKEESRTLDEILEAASTKMADRT
jgi:hypothetical protein